MRIGVLTSTAPTVYVDPVFHSGWSGASNANPATMRITRFERAAMSWLTRPKASRNILPRGEAATRPKPAPLLTRIQAAGEPCIRSSSRRVSSTQAAFGVGMTFHPQQQIAYPIIIFVINWGVWEVIWS